MRNKLNIITDGIVRPEDALIPGSDYIYINGLTHNESVLVFNSTKIRPRDLTYALIVLSI